MLHFPYIPHIIDGNFQGYYNAGWFKNELLACWSCIRNPKRISQTKSVCVNAPLEMMNTTDVLADPRLSISTQFQFGISNGKSRFRDGQLYRQ